MTFLNALKKWFYTNGTTVGTTTSRIPLLDTNGNPIGCNALYSILSLMMESRGTSVDATNIDTTLTSGMYSFTGTTAASPITDWGTLIVIRHSSNVTIQIKVCANKRAIIWRRRNLIESENWQTWNSLASAETDEDSTMIVERRYVDETLDIDTLTTPWTSYSASNATAKANYTGTFPTGVVDGSFELKVVLHGSRTTQYYYEGSRPDRFFMRVKNSNEAIWGAWYIYSGTAQS